MLLSTFGLGFGGCVMREAPCCPSEHWVGWSVCAGEVELLGQLQGVFLIGCGCDVMVSLQCGNKQFPAFENYCEWLFRRSCPEVGQASK